MLFADFFIFIGLLLLFYICGQYFDVLWFTGSVVMACGISSILFFLFCEWLVFYLYRIFEKEDCGCERLSNSSNGCDRRIML